MAEGDIKGLMWVSEKDRKPHLVDGSVLETGVYLVTETSWDSPSDVGLTGSGRCGESGCDCLDEEE